MSCARSQSASNCCIALSNTLAPSGASSIPATCTSFCNNHFDPASACASDESSTKNYTISTTYLMCSIAAQVPFNDHDIWSLRSEMMRTGSSAQPRSAAPNQAADNSALISLPSPASPPVNFVWSKCAPPRVFPLSAPGMARAKADERFSKASRDPLIRWW
jgi:hypothetical protein